MFDTPFWISYGLPVVHSGLWSLGSNLAEGQVAVGAALRWCRSPALPGQPMGPVL
jgi:hypothetical protein